MPRRLTQSAPPREAESAQGETEKRDRGWLGYRRRDLYVVESGERPARLKPLERPDPAPGHAYQLWLGASGAFRPVGHMFVPRNGAVLIELTVDVSRYDEVWITEETAGVPPTSPSTAGRSWRAELP